MKLEQTARQTFETWWEHEGQEFLFALNTTTDDDIKLVAEIAWKNGAYCAEQAEQEPVAWLWVSEHGSERLEWEPVEDTSKWKSTPLYAAPVRTKDLTADEIEEFYTRIWSGGKKSMFAFARAVIAADREKNK